jgi:hypothetical protein
MGFNRLARYRFYLYYFKLIGVMNVGLASPCSGLKSPIPNEYNETYHKIKLIIS